MTRTSDAALTSASFASISRRTDAECAADRFVGSSPRFRAVLREIELLARFDRTTVLIEGETGTGKSYVARYLHTLSPRSAGPFHQVILSTLDDNLAASDLFGHLSGSYTDARHNRPGHFVTGHGGTLFLDEIGKASPAVQRKLLHAIEHQEITPVGADRSIRVDVRLVAASNLPLSVLVARGDFLVDLAARLTNFRVVLPTVRERREDIPALVRQFIGLRAATFGHPVPPRVSPSLMEALQRAEWPNNLRQLDGAVQRLLMEGVGCSELTLEHCGGELVSLQKHAIGTRALPTAEQLLERIAALGTVTAAADSFGISRCTAHRRLGRNSKIGD